MSTLSLPASHSTPAGYVEAVCIGCPAAIEIPASTAIPRCTACQRSGAEAEAKRLLQDARQLRDGVGVYAGLTADERREQLQSLVLSTAKDDWKPEVRPLEQAFADFINVLSDSSLDLMADLIARKIADRDRKPVAGRTPTLIRVAIADLSDSALIELVGTSDNPVILNAASMELAGRLGNATDSYRLPIYSKSADADPTPAERDAIESTIETDIPAALLADEHPLAGKFDGIDAA